MHKRQEHKNIAKPQRRVENAFWALLIEKQIENTRKMRNDEFRSFSFVHSTFHTSDMPTSNKTAQQREQRQKTFPCCDEVEFLQSEWTKLGSHGHESWCSSTSIFLLPFVGPMGRSREENAAKQKTKLSTDSRNTPILMDQRALKGGERKTSAITLLKFVFKWAGSCGNFSLLFKNFYYFSCSSIKAGDSMASDATDGGSKTFF